jgi:hypothetical protein
MGGAGLALARGQVAFAEAFQGDGLAVGFGQFTVHGQGLLVERDGTGQVAAGGDGGGPGRSRGRAGRGYGRGRGPRGPTAGGG